MALKKKHIPTFARPNYGRTSRSRIGTSWRRPRGIDNKKRIGVAKMGCSPMIGYGQAADVKGRHPSGAYEVYIENLKQMEKFDPKTATIGPAGTSPSQAGTEFVVRIAGGVGKRLKNKIIAAAQSKNLRVLNP